MSHLLTNEDVLKHTRTISETKQARVANLQKHIQEILSDEYHTFIQGSYKNTTAISDINDVDIVAVKLNVYSAEHSSVVIENPVPYPWEKIFIEIIEKLKNQHLYQWRITPKEKCITIETTNLKADIVPAIQVHEDVTIDPIAIRKYSGNHLTYPRIHFKNGVTKHSRTNNNYKPLVRMFKNWAKNYLPLDTISSHKIESLLYNIPDENFMDDHFVSFILISSSIIKLLSTTSNKILSVCGSENICDNWDISKRQLFINKLSEAKNFALLAYKSTSQKEALSNWNKAHNI